MIQREEGRGGAHSGRTHTGRVAGPQVKGIGEGHGRRERRGRCHLPQKCHLSMVRQVKGGKDAHGTWLASWFALPPFSFPANWGLMGLT